MQRNSNRLKYIRVRQGKWLLMEANEASRESRTRQVLFLVRWPVRVKELLQTKQISYGFEGSSWISKMRTSKPKSELKETRVVWQETNQWIKERSSMLELFLLKYHRQLEVMGHPTSSCLINKIPKIIGCPCKPYRPKTSRIQRKFKFYLLILVTYTYRLL